MSALPIPEMSVPIWHGLADVPADFGPCVVTLGVFDGLHRGHRRLVERALRVGEARALPTVLVTFDPHPARVLGLPRDTAQLTTVERRAELAGLIGVDAVCVLPFTRSFAALPPVDFVVQVLVDALQAAAVVVGANFTFGHRAAGNVDTLHELGERYGFTARGIGLLHEVDARCSSTYIRCCLGRGDIHAASRALGRPHRVDGWLRRAGSGAGELVPAEGTALPGPGRYSGNLADGAPAELQVTDDGRLLVRAGNVGGGRLAVEFTGRVSG
jgi:riboflavin kinase/FMN adenylyltransferase